MPDSPDYQKYLPGSVRFSLQDMGELAVRMGSPDLFDRRGEVVLMDRFDHGVGSWFKQTYDADSDALLSDAHTIHGGFSYLLKAGTGPDKLIQTNYSFPVNASNRYGFEVTFGHTGAFGYLSLNFIHYVPEGSHDFTLKLDYVNNIVSVTEFGGAARTVGVMANVLNDTPSFSTIKLVYDVETRKYVRLIFNTLEVDLSGIDMPFGTADTGRKIDLFIEFKGGTGTMGKMYLSSIIVTANEP